MNMKGRRVHEIPSYYEDITAVCFSLQSSIVDHPPLLLLPLQRSKRNIILHAWRHLDNLLSDSGVYVWDVRGGGFAPRNIVWFVVRVTAAGL